MNLNRNEHFVNSDARYLCGSWASYLMCVPVCQYVALCVVCGVEQWVKSTVITRSLWLNATTTMSYWWPRPSTDVWQWAAASRLTLVLSVVMRMSLVNCMRGARVERTAVFVYPTLSWTRLTRAMSTLRATYKLPMFVFLVSIPIAFCGRPVGRYMSVHISRPMHHIIRTCFYFCIRNE